MQKRTGAKFRTKNQGPWDPWFFFQLLALVLFSAVSSGYFSAGCFSGLLDVLAASRYKSTSITSRSLADMLGPGVRWATLGYPRGTSGSPGVPRGTHDLISVTLYLARVCFASLGSPFLKGPHESLGLPRGTSL